ncbi:MAG: DNA/RNA non-specific endonuclease, partial [Tidjanibacter sp.]|nr:DNA/RNA non-specific endonuclease [Tidjanibacter sp.]
FTADQQRYYFSKHMLASSGNTARSFSLLYDSDIYHSLWVAYPISKLHTPGGGSRKDDWGRMDPNIPSSKQVYLKSSFNSNYDRGHLCPAATRFHPNTTENCQLLSIPTNMSPQLSGLNQEKWAQIEGQVRSWGSGCDTLYVVTGAVFRTVGGNENISYAYGKSDSSKQVAVPNYYYKALLQRRGTEANSTYQAMALWVPHKATNNDVPTSQFVITIDELEKRTGIDFFHNLDDATEQAVEQKVDSNFWKM